LNINGRPHYPTVVPITPPETMGVNIYSDFEALIMGDTDKELLLKTRQAGEITRERFLREEQRRGVFSVDMDAEEEAKAVEIESVNDLKNFLPEEGTGTEEL